MYICKFSDVLNVIVFTRIAFIVDTQLILHIFKDLIVIIRMNFDFQRVSLCHMNYSSNR